MQENKKIPLKQKVKELKEIFLLKYQDAQTELIYSNVYELLVAVMLSAQCTDKRVNIVTKDLFRIYPTPNSLAKADIVELKEIIKSVSFFNMKAQNLIKMATRVVEHFNSEIPTNQKDLMSLAGVGQKSANVVLGEFLGLNFMAVDTHVFRVSHRLGLSKEKGVIETELRLTKLFKDHLNVLHQAFVLFGRYHCKALNPACSECYVKKYCITNKNFKPS